MVAALNEPPAETIRRGFASGERAGRIVRTGVALQVVLLFTVAGASLGLEWGVLAAGSVLLWFLYSAAVAYNDLVDVAVDRANNKQVALAVDIAEPTDARRVLKLAAVAVAALQLVLPQPGAVLFSASAILLGYYYSNPWISLQSRGLIRTLVLATMYVAGPLGMALAFHGKVAPGSPALVVGSLLLAGGALIYADVPDEEGDRVGGKRTLVVRYGPDRARLISVLMMSTALWPLFASGRYGVFVVAGFGACAAAIVHRTSGDPIAVIAARLCVIVALLLAATQL